MEGKVSVKALRQEGGRKYGGPCESVWSGLKARLEKST